MIAGGLAPAKYAYVNDTRARRTSVVRTGEAFSGGSGNHHDSWGYNDRNELTGSTRRSGTTVGEGAETTSLGRTYAYDSIGNRSTYTRGNDAQTTYTANSLNQYDPIETASSPETGQRLSYDADGNITESYVTGDLDGDGSVGLSDLAILNSSYGYCEGDPEYDERANIVTGSNPECVDFADYAALLSLFGLNGTAIMRAALTWDAENRLSAYVPLNSAGNAKKFTFKYDYQGRRVEKNVYAWNSGGSPPDWYANPTERRRFVWNGWLMLRETIETDSASDGTFEATRVKTYTRGRDVGAHSGAGILPANLESAGGIGGLLALYDDNGTSSDLSYIYMFDANGNVGQVVDWAATGGPGVPAGALVAKYEYDVYGNVIESGGTYLTANTIRFSTKYWDEESGLGYWGHRFYEPRIGRWTSRDSAGELDDLWSLYSFVGNAIPQYIDALGMKGIPAVPRPAPRLPPFPPPCKEPNCTGSGTTPHNPPRAGPTTNPQPDRPTRKVPKFRKGYHQSRCEILWKDYKGGSCKRCEGAPNGITDVPIDPNHPDTLKDLCDKLRKAYDDCKDCANKRKDFNDNCLFPMAYRKLLGPDIGQSIIHHREEADGIANKAKRLQELMKDVCRDYCPPDDSDVPQAGGHNPWDKKLWDWEPEGPSIGPLGSN